MLSSGQEFDEKFLDSKHDLKVYFKPSRKKKYFEFLPLPILPVWLKFLHLGCFSSNFFLISGEGFNTESSDEAILTAPLTSAAAILDATKFAIEGGLIFFLLRTQSFHFFHDAFFKICNLLVHHCGQGIVLPTPSVRGKGSPTFPVFRVLHQLV